MPKKKMMKIIDKVAMVLVAVGAINWGLVGLLDFNLVEKLLSTIPYAVTTVYTLVGVSGIYSIYKIFK